MKGVIKMARKPRIYITGDTHGNNDIDKLTSSHWPEGRELTKDDILIIADDFGLVFYPKQDSSERYWLDWLDARPWTTLFIYGNHENFDRLYNEYLCEERYGGPVGVIRPSVLHLRQRGHVYIIAGKRFWCFGGATSIDKAYRTESRSWWPQEEPTAEQTAYGLSQIERYGGKFDFVVTHDCPSRVLYACWDKFRLHNSISKIIPGRAGQYLECVADLVSAKYWYFGHYMAQVVYLSTPTHSVIGNMMATDAYNLPLRTDRTGHLLLQKEVFEKFVENSIDGDKSRKSAGHVSNVSGGIWIVNRKGQENNQHPIEIEFLQLRFSGSNYSYMLARVYAATSLLF